MKTLLAGSVAALALAVANAGPIELSRDILGIRLSMPHDAVQKRLKELGKFSREESKRQEVWEVRNPSFSHVIVGFDAKQTVRFVTAVAREDAEAKRLRYSDIGDLDQARQAGDPAIKNFNYEWKLEPKGENPEALVIVRGRDAELFSTYALKRISDEPVEQENE